MMIKQSTAITDKWGPFVDDTDGKTAETGLTIQKANVRVSKNGGNMAAASSDQGASDVGAPHDELGVYDGALDATDTGTLGILRVDIQMSGALPYWKEYQVVSANVWNSLVGGTDYLEVDSVALSGDATAADNAESFFDGTGYAGTNNVIPTVTDVTNEVSADVTKISGDAAAADNAEAFFDGTGYAGTNNVIPTVTDVTNEVSADVTKISGDATAADNLELAADGTGYNLGGGLVVAASVTGAVGSVTAEVTADVVKISGDATAADNAESFFDGTGYAGTNNVIPTVTDVTNEVPADVTKISGSATAADNLEASALGVVSGATIAGTLTTTSFPTDLTEATDDHYNGRVVVFVSGVLAGQAKAVLDYDGASKTLTTRTFTEAPGVADLFVLV